MELFPDGHHVRLRSLGRDGMYLHAAEDGVGVYLSPRRASLNAAWQVHLVERNGGTFVLLHGAAYGRYLAATDDPAPRGHIGQRVVQRAYNDEHDEEAMSWTPAWVPSGHREAVLLRHVTATSTTTRRLRANGKYCWWRTGVSVDETWPDTMMHWVVEDIPPRQSTPALPHPSPAARRGRFWNRIICLTAPVEEARTIRFVQAADDGSFSEEGWREIQFQGRSVFKLRLEVARELNPGELNSVIGIKLAVRAGNLGRLISLVVDLPRNLDPIDCIVLNYWTDAADELRDPDVDA